MYLLKISDNYLMEQNKIKIVFIIIITNKKNRN